MIGWMRPQSAPTGGDVAVCPHCWGVNVGGERLCHRCGADMTLLLQESGGLRRVPAAQSPMPVQVSHRLGPVMRAAVLLMTALLAAAWLVAPLLGNTHVFTRMHRASGRAGKWESGGTGRPRPAGLPSTRGQEGPFVPGRAAAGSGSPAIPFARSDARRETHRAATTTGRV